MPGPIKPHRPIVMLVIVLAAVAAGAADPVVFVVCGGVLAALVIEYGLALARAGAGRDRFTEGVLLGILTCGALSAAVGVSWGSYVACGLVALIAHSLCARVSLVARRRAGA